MATSPRPPSGPGGPPAPGSGAGRGGPERPRRGRRRTVLGVFAVLLLLSGLWVETVATRPGNERFVAKAADWFRDHQMQTLANWAERWYYTQKAPPVGGVPSRTIPATVPSPVTSSEPARAKAPLHSTLPAPIEPVAHPTLANEGVWEPLGPLLHGSPTMALAQLRPDAKHTSVLAGVVWIDPKLVRFQLVPGTVEPGGQWAVKGSVPPDQFGSLIGAFNGGFRIKDSRGGFYAEGREEHPLLDAAASLVLRADGTVDVGAWGRDDSMSSNVVAVRQNLTLIVDGGAPVAGIDSNAGNRWGATLGNKVLVWRSGVGVRADGTLLYAAGNGLTAASLADLLARAGAVRAMELDINPEWVTFNVYAHPDPANPASIDARKLLPDMQRPATRYLGADSRDFIAIFSR